MIEVAFFAYTHEQWKPIGVHIKAALGVDAEADLRRRIELAASLYPLHSAVKRRSLRRDELVALRKSAEDLREAIVKAVAVPISNKGNPLKLPLILPGADADMLTATSHYFRKLIRNPDRMVAQARPRRESARKIDRDQYWNELLAIWCELGGKATGAAAADFLMLASLPVMSVVPPHASVVQWLERRQRKVAKTAR
jgi:hypothetical protein